MELGRTTQGIVILSVMVASLMAVSEAKTLVVGGSQGWRYGFNYTDWALQNSPFYISDVLVFKYPPNAGQSVYLLPNLYSYMTCDMSEAKLVASAKEGSGRGFKIALNEWKPYYFASGEGKGNDCDKGQMKFFAVPWPRW